MESQSTPASRSLRFVSVLLRAAVILTALLAAVPLLGAARTSSAEVRVPATLGPPFRIEHGDTQFRFDAHGISADRGYGDTLGTFSPTEVRGTITTADTVTVVAHHAGRTLAAILAVLGLLRLHRVVLAARAGQPFQRRNATDLRTAGLSSLAIAVVLYAHDLTITSTTSAGNAIDIHPTLIDPWPFVLAGAIALGIAEIFRHGADLDEFDQLTI